MQLIRFRESYFLMAVVLFAVFTVGSLLRLYKIVKRLATRNIK